MIGQVLMIIAIAIVMLYMLVRDVQIQRERDREEDLRMEAWLNEICEVSEPVERK